MNVGDVARLKLRAADLRDRRAQILQGQRDNDTARQAVALKSALDAAAPARGFEQMVNRAALLAAQAEALDQAIADADAAVSQAEAATEHLRRATDREAVRGHLIERVELAGEIEAALRALLPKVTAFSDLGLQIERCSAKLDGYNRILPALAPEAAGGRLAEFMAGLGYGAWLPLTRPETRPAIVALKETEEAVQRPYLARFGDESAREALP